MSIFLGNTPIADGNIADQTYDATSANAQSGTAVAGLLEAVYPVGSIYITTASTCPLSALISGSTWELVSSGRVLQGADSGHSAGTTIEAGLPNITGYCAGMFPGASTTGFSGALYKTGNSYAGLSANTDNNNAQLGFDASRSSSIYGNSSTVQPPAYVVNIYRRTN